MTTDTEFAETETEAETDVGAGTEVRTETVAPADAEAAGETAGSKTGGLDRSPSRSTSSTSNAPVERERIVARLFDAFNGRDVEAALALVHEEIVFLPVSAAVMSDGEAYHGHEGIRRYIDDVGVHWEELIVEPVQIRAAGRAVVALGKVSGKGPIASFSDAPTTWVLKFREGRVIHAQIFSDESNMREAFGL